jgi:hypothetical protein
MTSPLPKLRKGLVACIGACLWLLSSCGGGAGGQASNTGNGGGIGSGGTGSYTNGPISGLGSIIVNSVRYDVGQAQVISDDDVLTANPAVHTADDLKLGMQVEVSGGTLAAGANGALATAAAGQVRFASALLGPVDTAYDGACTCLYVLGQKVLIGATTVWPKDLQAGNVVEVYGQPDLTQAGHQLVATRVQRVTDGSRPYKLVGWVSADDLALGTVTVHGPSSNLTLSYSLPSQVSALDDIGAHGQRVRVWMQHSLDAQQRHALVKLVVDTTLVSDQGEARLEGLVTVAADAGTGRMSINGQVVDVSGVGVLASVISLPVGQRVRVDGSLVDGLLKVTEVYVGGGDGGDDDDSGIELHGRPTAFGNVNGDPNHATMVVRGITVLYALSLEPPNLQGLSCVEVEGSGFNAADQLIATAVKADNSCHGG